jgi:hypothetical protein
MSWRRDDLRTSRGPRNSYLTAWDGKHALKRTSTGVSWPDGGRR